MKHTGLNSTMLLAVSSSVMLHQHFLWLILRCCWCNSYYRACNCGMV